MASSDPGSDGDIPDDAQSPTDHSTATPIDSAQPHFYPNIPGASVYTPNSTPSSTALNPRSCVTCRRRKVRCDKHMPCSNCRRAQIPCVFPAPGRAPRRPRPKDPNAPPKHSSSEREIELMKRLRKLEGIVEDLSGQIELETARNHTSNGNSPEAMSNHSSDAAGATTLVQRSGSASVSGRSNSQGSPASGGVNKDSPGRLAPAGNDTRFGPLAGKRPSDMHKRFGRLVINDHGKSRYVSSAFWSKITDELDELRAETQKLTDEESEDSGDDCSIEAEDEDVSKDHHAFIFGYRSADVDLTSLHPLPSQIPYIWQVYQENVEPLVKILHIPTMNKLFRELRSDVSSLDRPTEALMFAIYYSAITSLEEDDVKLNFGVDKPELITRFRFALEQALAKAHFLTSSNIVTLQAFALFLVLVRRHDDTRFAWTLTALIIRISQSIGLHRDGTFFSGLTPFQIEERRRLFWAIAILDLRSAEDQGTDLSIMDRTFDTQLPLNINDADIDPESTELPQPRDGPTDMTFSLIRYEICSLARKLHTVTSALAPVCPRDAEGTIEDRERLLIDVYRRIENTYLKDSSTEGNPIYWVAANIARVIVAKMTLIIYQPVLFPKPGDDELPNESRDRLFNAAIDIFEYAQVLNTDPRCKNWRWLFQTYTQWHAVAYVLMEVTRRTWSPTVERAWTALNTVFSSPRPLELQRIADRAAVWLPFRKLYFKAKKHRDAELARLRADPQACMELELEDRARMIPTSFAAMSGSVKSVLAIDRWRKLVNAPPLPPDVAPPKIDVFGEDKNQVKKQIEQTQSSSSSAAPPSTTTAMDYVEELLHQPGFEPESFWPLALSVQPSEVVAADPVHGSFLFGGSGDLPRQDDTLRRLAQNPNPQQQQQQTPQVPQTQVQGQQQQATPLVNAVKADYGPPWLWNSGSYPEVYRYMEPAAEEADVNMDEDFNWQDWGQTLRGFEVENGSGAASGVWGI